MSGPRFNFGSAATGDTIVATATNAKDGVRSQITFTYYANETMFVTQAWRPTDGHTGLVGEWAATVKLVFPDDPARAAEDATATYQLRADGTFTSTSKSGDAAVVTEQGTYHEATPGIFQMIPTGATVGRSLQMIDGAALVFPTRIFQRS